MLGRIVEVATDGVHLSTERGFLLLSRKGDELGRVPLDDIASVVVHGHGATFSANLCERLAARKAPLVLCGGNHAPTSLVWPLDGHFEQGRRMDAQIAATRPLHKRLWRDIVKAKITAQAEVLDIIGQPLPALREMVKRVKSGDGDNLEAQAARRYWPRLMGEDFRRDRSEAGVNALLNYGYTILRSGTARAIVSAGLHPSLSIHHESRGGALRLSDDLMEPFRPYVDLTVHRLARDGAVDVEPEAKQALAMVMTLDLEGPSGLSPLQSCLNRLATSLAQVFLGERSSLDLPGPPPPLVLSGS